VQSLALTALKDIIKQRQGNTYVQNVKKENMTLKSPKTIVLVNYVVQATIKTKNTKLIVNTADQENTKTPMVALSV